MRHRFEAILAPDERWMVFDILLGRPAELDGRSLIGLPARECGEITRRMNLEQRADAGREDGSVAACKQGQLQCKS